MSRILRLSMKLIVCILFANIASADISQKEDTNKEDTNIGVELYDKISKSLANLRDDKTHINLYLGGVETTAGKTQQVNVDFVLPAEYTFKENRQWNAVLGLTLLGGVGVFREFKTIRNFLFSYGVGAFYLSKVRVSGIVSQAKLFNNLGYSYDITNIPAYVFLKTKADIFEGKHQLVLDVGFGPNVMTMYNYGEWAINRTSLKDNAFKGSRETTLSFTSGFAIHFNKIFGDLPVELGYRFFYLGVGHLNINNNQYATNLSTGPSYANAIVCSLII
jgi:hypothetical protein